MSPNRKKSATRKSSAVGSARCFTLKNDEDGRMGHVCSADANIHQTCQPARFQNPGRIAVSVYGTQHCGRRERDSSSFVLIGEIKASLHTGCSYSAKRRGSATAGYSSAVLGMVTSRWIDRPAFFATVEWCLDSSYIKATVLDSLTGHFDRLLHRRYSTRRKERTAALTTPREHGLTEDQTVLDS